MINRHFTIISAIFAVLFFLLSANFAVSAATLEYKQLALTDAEVLKRCEYNAVKSAWAYAEPDLIPWLFAHKREPVKKEEGGTCYK